MSYCRGEVYVIGTGHGDKAWWECLTCKIAPTEKIVLPDGREVEWPESMTFDTREELLEHLKEHEAAGHDTDYAIPRVEAELRGEDFVYPPSEDDLACWRMEDLMLKLSVTPMPKRVTYDMFMSAIYRQYPEWLEHPELDPFDVMSPWEVVEALNESKK